jgi:hypothetical protein
MGEGLRLSSGLLLTPLLVAAAFAVLPRIPAEMAIASLVAFTGAAGVALAGLSLAGTAQVSRRLALSFAAVAATALGVVAYRQSGSIAACVTVDAALVGLAWALGGSLGRSVQHPAHLFPACVVAASADVVSLLSPEGPSHAVANSERALSVLAVWFPVAGSRAVSPALGIGDLLFVAFVLGVARAHHLPYARVIVCCALGIAAAGLAAACLHVAFPALVPIALATIIGLPRIRQLRAVDRRPAHVSMLLAAAVALVTIARSAVEHF